MARTKRAQAAQVQQFATMDGWQAGVDARFDTFVEEKRRDEAFERFDQRVDAAFKAAVKAHTREIWNGTKRMLKGSNKKYDTKVLIDTNRQIEGRADWLRGVFAQIDMDYRSADPVKKTAAADEISRALNGEPSDFITWAYERKGQTRFYGKKQQMQEAAVTDDDANMPDISHDEANRYLNLKPRMSEIERKVKETFGRAGEEHWDHLQTIKNHAYDEKIREAAVKYKKLLDQEHAYHAANAKLGDNALSDRMDTASIRFKAAMEIEDQRLKLVEAHNAMQKERFEEARRQQREYLRQAAEMKQSGKTSAEVASVIRQQTMDKFHSETEQTAMQEQVQARKKKQLYLDIIEELESQFEQSDGAKIMGNTEDSAGLGISSPSPDESSSAFGFDTEDISPSDKGSSTSGTAILKEARELAAERGEPNSAAALKRAVWDVINGNKLTDPYLMVHQARMDARANYDDVYRTSKPFKKRLGPLGDIQTGDDMTLTGWRRERYTFDRVDHEQSKYTWGLKAQDMMDLDQDGNNQWGNMLGTSAMQTFKNPKTGDIDYTRTRRLSQGPVWQGTHLYKMGYDADMKADRRAQPIRLPKEK